MKRFLNLPERVVDEVLGSFVQLAPVTLSAPGKGVRIVARADWKKDRVALISGGGAGHEPAHAGFVGEGMLTAAVSGELFASPSVDAVLAAIRHVTGSPGCLLIVKNYTGDRLNFGLAAERARAEGLNVGVVIVGDDVALEKSVKPRGIAGTVLVHKYAGWMAAKGLGLDEILTRITAFAELPMTLGLALSGCDVPGRAAETGGHGPELGLGIHNEPGAQEVNPASAREAMQLVLTPLLAEAVRRDPAPETRYVAFLNNLGGCSTQEMGVLAHDLLDIAGVERLALMVAPSSLMTSLNMPGFSVTLLPAQSDFVEALSSPTNAPAWPGVLTPHKTQYFEPAVDYLDKDKPYVSSGAPVEQNPSVVAAISRITEVLISSKEELDSLDMKVGDGDAGTTIAAGSQ
ncbi:MAG: dihydroxyacetone kinase subunit DhaK, partial [Candidatus Methylacidiphilales bacterium]